MPYSRRYFRRRSFQKRRMFRRKNYSSRRYTNNYRQGKGDGKRFFKLRFQAQITSDAGGQIQGWYNDDVSGYQDWASISALFDSYRVCALKLQFIPDLPNDTSTITGYKPFYVLHDPDSASVPTLTIASALQYENCKVFNMYRPWTYYRRLAKQTSSGVAGQVMLAGGYKDVAVTTASQSINFTGNGFDISTTYGQFILTAYIVAKNRR